MVKPWRVAFLRLGEFVWSRRRLMTAAVVALSLIAMVPVGFWGGPAAAASRFGWRWLLVGTTVAGLVVLAEGFRARWRQGGTSRRRPVAERVPLFAHVGGLLVVAVVVAVAAGYGLWTVLGRPDLSASSDSGPHVAGWSVANTLDTAKIVLSIVAGIGGVVALTVAYRKQDHGEAAEHRENTKLFNDRFGKAAEQLGSDKAAVRLAGTYAMAGLADDWEEGRQTCIDVLCAFLRAPYDPPADPQQSPPREDKDGAAAFVAERRAAREQQQVRYTVIALIRDHLTPVQDDAPNRPRWHGYVFDLSGATFDGGSFARVDLRVRTSLNLCGAEFSGGQVDFRHAEFSGGLLDFGGAKFSGGHVSFSFADFSGGEVAFRCAEFSGGQVDFGGAEFSGGHVDFHFAKFSGSEVEFSGAGFSGSVVEFGAAEFSGGRLDFDFNAFSDGMVSFGGAEFSGGQVDFRRTAFYGGQVNFRNPRVWSTPPTGVDPAQEGVLWPEIGDSP